MDGEKAVLLIYCSFSLLAQRKRTKRKGPRSLVPPMAGYPVLLEVAGSLKTRPPLADSNSLNSQIGNFCGARQRDDGKEQHSVCICHPH